jgi:hypothetical protein
VSRWGQCQWIQITKLLLAACWQAVYNQKIRDSCHSIFPARGPPANSTALQVDCIQVGVCRMRERAKDSGDIYDKSIYVYIV